MNGRIVCRRDAATHISTITINRPEARNAFTLDMMRRFRAALEDLESDDAIKVIVIQGEGRDLCAGMDVAEAATLYRHGDARAGQAARPSLRARLAAHHELWWGPQGLYHRLLHCRKITVAAAKGRCFGTGFNLCLYSDLVMAAEGASFSQPRWAHVGVDGDIAMLVAAVGLRRARELMFLSATWPAQAAWKYGLVDGVVPGRQLARAVGGLADSCAMIMRDGIAAEKQVVLASLAKLQVELGFAAASVLGGWASNILHRPGEFNFLRELRDHGPGQAIRRSNAHFGRR